MSDPALDRASMLLELKRPAEAEHLLRNALAEQPDSAYALALLAQALGEQDRHQEGRGAAERAIGLDPEDLFVRLVLVDTLCALEAGERALVVAEESASLWPMSWQAHYALARALIALPRPRMRDAIGVLDHARTLAPHEARILALRGLILLDLTERAAAERSFHDALALDPESTMALHGLTLLQAQRGKLRHAGRTVTAALRTDPQSKVLAGGIDAIVFALLRRWALTLVLGTVLIAIALGMHAPYVVRVAVAVAVLTVYAWVARRATSELPRGARLWAPASLRRLSARNRWPLGIVIVLTVLFVGVALLPRDLALISAGAILVIARTVLIFTVLGAMFRAILTVVRGISRRLRKNPPV